MIFPMLRARTAQGADAGHAPSARDGGRSGRILCP